MLCSSAWQAIITIFFLPLRKSAWPLKKCFLLVIPTKEGSVSCSVTDVYANKKTSCFFFQIITHRCFLHLHNRRSSLLLPTSLWFSVTTKIETLPCHPDGGGIFALCYKRPLKKTASYPLDGNSSGGHLPKISLFKNSSLGFIAATSCIFFSLFQPLISFSRKMALLM